MTSCHLNFAYLGYSGSTSFYLTQATKDRANSFSIHCYQKNKIQRVKANIKKLKTGDSLWNCDYLRLLKRV